MKNVIAEEVKVLGRPVNPNSARQIRLAELEAKRQNGELKRGRPVNENSERQARLKQQAENKALGLGQKPRLRQMVELLSVDDLPR